MESIYRSYFGLQRDPFNVTPDSDFLYLSSSHREALANLVYGIKARKGFVVLTGEVGAGKTTLIHALLEELNGNTRTALIFNTILGPKEFLRYVCDDFGLTPAERGSLDVYDYLVLLNRFLLESYERGCNVALIVDEAQNLSAEVLESIRLLSNFETAKDKLLQIFLVGQPELGTRLNSPELRQLKQRIMLRHHLQPLTLAECKEYVAKRLEVAGGTPIIFTSNALETIYLYSAGTPRLINILCDNGMLTAYASGKKTVNDILIREVAADLNITPSLEAESSLRLSRWWSGKRRNSGVPSGTERPPMKTPSVGSPESDGALSKVRRFRWRPAAVLFAALCFLILGTGYLITLWNDFSIFQPRLLGALFEKLNRTLKYEQSL
ncbi:MAG: AAA family ATPase [Deltaproteobacteria bacterium]|nr:AAA family ATPase [Deltaproteobacteria bacterium]